jgi:ribosomal protein L24
MKGLGKVIEVHGIREGDTVQIVGGEYKGHAGIVLANIKHKTTWRIQVVGIGEREIEHKHLAQQ